MAAVNVGSIVIPIIFLNEEMEKIVESKKKKKAVRRDLLNNPWKKSLPEPCHAYLAATIGFSVRFLLKHKNTIKHIAYALSKLYAIDPKSCSKGIEVCHALSTHGIFATLGKFSKDSDPPEQIVGECRQCSASMNRNTVENNFYLSLKPPALQFNLDHVKNIAAVALQKGHGIHFDSHDHILMEPTLQLLQDSIRHIGPGQPSKRTWQWGVTVPSRWKRSVADVRWAVKNAVRVRLVKGEFRAAHVSEEMNACKGFLKLVDLVSGNAPELAVATHDYELAKEAIVRARKKGTHVQLELLFGMPAAPMIALSREMHVPLRFYVAYGETLLLYGIRHLAVNPHKLVRSNAFETFQKHDLRLSRIITLYD